MSRTGRKKHRPDSTQLDADGPQPVASTTWGIRRVKITSPTPEASKTASGAGRWRRVARRNPREKLTLVIHYRGGPEAWYEVQARGSRGRFHGATAIHDVMREINEGQRFWTDAPDFIPPSPNGTS